MKASAKAGEAEAGSSETTTAVAVADRGGAVATQTDIGLVSGEFNGLRLPTIRMAYGVGGLADNFKPGDLVIHGGTDADVQLLVPKDVKLRVIIVSAVPYIKDRLTREEFNMHVQAKRYRSKAEALAAGRVVDWAPRGSSPDAPKPNITNAIDLRLLVQRPEGIESDWFSIKIGDHKYAPVDTSWDKGSYESVSKAILKRVNLVNQINQSNARALARDPNAKLEAVPPICFFSFWSAMTKTPKGDAVPLVNTEVERAANGLQACPLSEIEVQDLNAVISDVLNGSSVWDSPEAGAPTGSIDSEIE